MCLLQRGDAPGNDVVMGQHLLDRARLLLRELPIDIGDQKLVAEFGHCNPSCSA